MSLDCVAQKLSHLHLQEVVRAQYFQDYVHINMNFVVTTNEIPEDFFGIAKRFK